MDTQVIIERVKKLLSLSQSSNLHEASAAAAAANKLIDQYRISQEDLSDKEEEIVEDTSYIYENGRAVYWKSGLVLFLANHYGCAVINKVGCGLNGRRTNNYQIIGRKSDIQITRYMFNWLLLESQRLSKKECVGKGHKFSNSYCTGFVCGINEQLVKSRQELKQQVDEKSIVALDSRVQKAKEFMREKYHPTNDSSKRQSSIDASAYSSGFSQGKSFHLGGRMESGQNIKMLGSG